MPKFQNLKNVLADQDVDVQPLGGYNNVEPPVQPEMNIQPIDPQPSPTPTPDGEDGQPGKNLDFTSSNKVQQLLQNLGQRFSNNLQKSNDVISQASNVMADRARYAMNPNLYGPPVPDQPLPQETAMNNMIGQGVMGIAAPGRNVIAKSAPWMKNLTEGTVQEALPVAEGLANSAKDTIYTQAAKAAQKFEQLKKALGGK